MFICSRCIRCQNTFPGTTALPSPRPCSRCRRPSCRSRTGSRSLRRSCLPRRRGHLLLGRKAACPDAPLVAVVITLERKAFAEGGILIICACFSVNLDEGSFELLELCSRAMDEILTADRKVTGWWLLRSPGSFRGQAACVNNGGSLSDCHFTSVTGCVRPALWLSSGMDAEQE